MAIDIRIGDHERQAAVDALTTAVGEGRLTLSEFERRSGIAWAAVHSEDLESVLHDLPQPEPTPERVPNDWIPWIAVNVLCVGIWLATCLAGASLLYPWPIWVAGPWGVILLASRFGGGCVDRRSS
ncbi:hypothetical protein GCM10007304_08340 [Rhodococcoides trifolii]|uniref:DUF1707 domain-containing protein n=1 Tax=Rhodococcoides trifolii TaxID=908250 RepID=A0A917CSR7_9NOCA|nr:DUF1707 domain-containing protein [Rhodococcus trifolii]GGF96700.1 hypothetical protein GCM10007304_08340 [Rhodococcus trifolii]